MADRDEAGRDEGPGFWSELLAPVAGFGVTFSTMFRKVQTEEYPEEKVAAAAAATTAGTS